MAFLPSEPAVWEDGHLHLPAKIEEPTGQQATRREPSDHLAQPELQVRPLQDRGQLTGAMLADHQAAELRPMATIYATVRDKLDITEENLQEARWELKRLYHPMEAMCIEDDKVLTLEMADRGHTRRVAIVPAGLQRAVIWEVHQQTHASPTCTLAKICLDWY